jgi:hypothetical protein
MRRLRRSRAARPTDEAEVSATSARDAAPMTEPSMLIAGAGPAWPAMARG